MPELGPYGSVRGAAGNSRPYRERLHDDPIHTRRRQAFEKRQWTKSREGGATTVRRALRGFDRDADADEDGWNVARRG
jgi:hypothetical protein